MPRKKRSPKAEPVTVAETLAEHHPEIASIPVELEPLPDYKAPPAPTIPLHLEPLPPAQDHEQPPETPDSHWRNNVRPWKSYASGAGKAEGIKHVTFKVPMGNKGIMDMVGIQAPDSAPITIDEKPLLQDHREGYWKEPKAWGEQRNPDAVPRTQMLADTIAKSRMENGR